MPINVVDSYVDIRKYKIFQNKYKELGKEVMTFHQFWEWWHDDLDLVIEGVLFSGKNPNC